MDRKHLPRKQSVKPSRTLTIRDGAEVADWHRVISSMFVIPILALFLLLQKKIVSGITAGALK